MQTDGRFLLKWGAGRYIDGARIFLGLVLVIVIAFLLARIFWLVVAPTDAVATLTPRPLPSPIQQTTRANVRGDMSLLLTTNPFEGADGSAAVIADAPETQLNLKLVALFMSTEAGAGSATIVTPDNRALRVEPGKEILPGVRLERILSDRVIISRDGSEETLMRGGREAGLSVIGDPETAEVRTSKVSTPKPAMFSPGVTARTLLASIDPVAQTENGTVTAFTLRPRSNPSLMRDAGLQPGDQLVEINRIRVSELDSAALAAEFSSAQTVSVTVLRNGEAETLEIRFEAG